jgi:hypothetical protein
MGAIRTVTSADDIDRDDELVLVDTTSGDITVTLADVDTLDNPITIKKIAAGNTVTIATTDSQLIDGSATMTGNNQTMTLIPDQSADAWRKSNDLATSLIDLSATVEEINTACDGVTATASEINTAADGIADPPVAGDSTAGRVLRVGHLWITDGTDASTIACQLFSDWNGDAIAEEDNLAAGTPGTYFSLNQSAAAAPTLEILAAGLTGNCVAVVSATLYINDCGSDLLVWGVANAIFTDPIHSA